MPPEALDKGLPQGAKDPRAHLFVTLPRLDFAHLTCARADQSAHGGLLLATEVWDCYIKGPQGLMAVSRHQSCWLPPTVGLSLVACPCVWHLTQPGIQRWNTALIEWQDRFNRELHAYGMYIKTQVGRSHIWDL